MSNAGRGKTAALILVGLGVAGGLTAAALRGRPRRVAPQPKPINLATVDNALRALPLTFEPNQGQFDSSVSFVARGSGFEARLSASSASLLLYQPEAGSERLSVTAVAMRLEGGNPTATLEGVGELASVSNYLIGRDPAEWHTRIPNFGAVRYHDIYPGIDLLFHGGQGRLEYDFDLAPGADPGAIRLRFGDLDALSVGADGALRLAVGTVVLSQPPPGIFKRVAGGRESVAGGYYLFSPHEVGFRVDRSESGLLIDPVLIYSTYLGGSVGDGALAVAVDSAGSAYLAGQTSSPDFPTKNPFQGTYRGGTSLYGNAFVTKFDPTGSSLVYSTYLGGSSGEDGGRNGDEATGIALDDAGSAFVVGSTDSSDFPVTDGGYQLSLEGSLNVFLSRLDATGSNLEYSTYLGGNQIDFAKAVAVDNVGKAYVCGSAGSANFPLVQPIDRTPPPAFMNTGLSRALIRRSLEVPGCSSRPFLEESAPPWTRSGSTDWVASMSAAWGSLQP